LDAHAPWVHDAPVGDLKKLAGANFAFLEAERFKSGRRINDDPWPIFTTLQAFDVVR